MSSSHNTPTTTPDDTATRLIADPIPIGQARAYSAVEPSPTRVDSRPLSAVPPFEQTSDQFFLAGPVPAAQPPMQRQPYAAAPVSAAAGRPSPMTGVRVGPFCGAVVVTCVISGLLVWLLVGVLTLLVDAVPDTYWASTGVLPTPLIPTDIYIGWAIAANLATAGLLFVLIKLSIAPVGRWFGLLTMLLTGVAVTWSISAGGPWQHWAPTAVVIAVCGLSMASWGRSYGRTTTVNTHDF